jgi:prepilin signal peptidase PulO-like enzyme (type II secretory pathway)
MNTLQFIGSMILGLIVGSFLSMLIPRLHEDKKGIVAGRSECPHCHHTLGVLDLIPLLSYLALRGRCRYCKKPITAWYPLTELATALLFGSLFLSTADWANFLWLAPLFAVLVFIFFYDLRYKEIHDAVMAPGIVYALFLAWQMGHLQDSLLGAAIPVIFFGLQYLLSRGRWIGSGDLRIGAFMGAMLGWEATLLALLLSYVLGSVIGIVLLVTKKADGQTAVPLGPFLVLGTLLSFFWGDQLLAFYLSL